MGSGLGLRAAMLSEACAFLEDRKAASTLYSQFLPWSGQALPNPGSRPPSNLRASRRSPLRGSPKRRFSRFPQRTQDGLYGIPDRSGRGSSCPISVS